MPKICKKCNNEFPFHVVVEGKKRNLKTRKFCLDCSPFGKRNTKDLTKDTSVAYCKDCDESKPISTSKLMVAPTLNVRNVGVEGE
jgi:hypothetical protein